MEKPDWQHHINFRGKHGQSRLCEAGRNVIPGAAQPYHFRAMCVAIQTLRYHRRSRFADAGGGVCVHAN